MPFFKLGREALIEFLQKVHISACPELSTAQTNQGANLATEIES